MNKQDEIINILDQYPQYRETLFRRGYLITTRTNLDLDAYPFYGHWNLAKFGKLKDRQNIHIYYHELQDYHDFEENGKAISVIGHAYNPFNMKYKEEEILKDLLQAYNHGEETFFDKVSELTGIHLIIMNDNGKLVIVQDCSGMKSCYFGQLNNALYITSHPQILGDICNLKTDPFIKKLKNAWFFRKTTQYFPGNLSPYRELKRLGPNTSLTFDEQFYISRFYPKEDHIELTENRYVEVIDTIRNLIRNNIELCIKKWDDVAISISGGVDSKTTLSCANGFYANFKYYSYHCKPSEVLDAEAASQICNNLNLQHTTYPIPEKNEEIKDFGVLKKIISHNTSYIQVPGDHEIRKFIYLYWLRDFKVELKSWISETGRVNWERKHGVNLPLHITPRIMSIFQTRYFAAPKLLKKSDQSYKKFMEETNIEKSLFNYKHSDLLYWEVRWGSWGSTVVTAHDIFRSQVTMPLNNRKIIDMFLWFPQKNRKNDMVHNEIIKRSNKKLSEMNLTICNPYSSNKRKIMERIYFIYMTLFDKSSI